MTVCGCGHGRGAHRYLRPGSDCALCPCFHFRRRWLAAIRRQLGWT